MPPRKSIDLTKAATGDEGTPVKEASVREGVNIEVCNLRPLFIASTTSNYSIRALGNGECLLRAALTQLAGPQPPKEYCDEAGERRPTTQHTDPRQCYVSNDKKRNSIRKLSSNTVRASY